MEAWNLRVTWDIVLNNEGFIHVFDIGALLANRAFIKSKTDAFKCKSGIFLSQKSMLEVLI